MRNKLLILLKIRSFITFTTHFLYLCDMDSDVQSMLENIGEQLKELRKAKGYKQTEVMKITGVSRKTLSSLENGGNAKLDTFIKLLRLYKKLDIFENIKDWQPSIDMNDWTKQISQSKTRKELIKNRER